MTELHGQNPFTSPAPDPSPVVESLATGSQVPVEEAGTRIIACIEGAAGAGTAAPLLICIGGLHGNEPGGVHALERVARKLRGLGEGFALNGTLLALRGNRAALAHKKRFLDVDLNRAWSSEDVRRVRTQDPASDGSTDTEVRDLLAHIEKPLAAGRKVVLLDLHSTSGGGPPFSVVLGGRSSQRLAAQIGVPCVHGLNEAVQGTLTSWFSSRAGPSIVVEGGESRTEETIRHLEASVWSALAATGLMPADHPFVLLARQVLAQATEAIPRHVNVCHREKIKDLDFHMASPAGRRFKGFDFVRMGDHLADNKNGPVRATQDGYLVMPLYQNKGSEGFFLAEPCVDPSL